MGNETINAQQRDYQAGSCYIELILDSKGESKDFRFLEMDDTFLSLLNWQGNQSEDLKGSDVFRQWPQDFKKWQALCTNAVSMQKTQELTYWMSEDGRVSTMTAIPLNEEKLVLFLRPNDVLSAEQQEQNARKEVLRMVESLFSSKNFAVALIEFTGGEYRYIKNNPLHLKLTGVSEITGKKLSEIFKGDLFQIVKQTMDQAISSTELVHFERDYELGDRKFTLQTELTSILSSEGIPFILSYSKDISEINKFKKENQQLNNRLSAMFNQHAAIKIIFDVNTGKVLDINPSASAFYGYTEAEFLQLNIQDLNLNPVDLQKDHQKKQEHGSILFSSLPHILKDGSVRLLDIYSSLIWDGTQQFSFSIAFDVTERETLRQMLVHEEELLRTTLQSIADGVLTMDRKGRITSLNNAAQKITGWSSEEVQQQLFSDIFTMYDERIKEKVKLPIDQVIHKGEKIVSGNTAMLSTKQNQWIPIANSIAPIKDQSQKIQGAVMVFRDTKKENEHLKQIEFLSYHDPLTKLYNRHYIEEHFTCFTQAENYPITVVMADVNGLKLTNDVFGHKAGDELLKATAKAIKSACQEHHIVSRWGGDEFVLILPKTSPGEAEEIVGKIRETKIVLSQNGGLDASVSLGFATAHSEDKTIVRTLKEAEEHMYHQKLLDGQSYRNSIINTLLATLFENSTETEEHSQRLLHHCHGIGRKMGLSSREMDDLALLSLLHDIGKVGINPSILNKPGKLTEDEWKEMKTHPEIGYRIAQSTPELAPFAHLILSHHERWDGKGYPHGLQAVEIPLACRILAVADTFDAMTNDRVYRSASTQKEALAEIKRNAGTQFDPVVVEIFLSLFNENANQFV